MKDMSLHKIILCSCGLAIGLVLLLSLLFSVFGIDTEGVWQYANGFDLKDGYISVELGNVHLNESVSEWLKSLYTYDYSIGISSGGIVEAEKEMAATVKTVVTFGRIISILIIIASCVLMAISVVSLFFSAKKRHDVVILAVVITSCILSLALMLYGIIGCAMLNNNLNLTQNTLSTATYGGFIIIAVMTAGYIAYCRIAKKRGFDLKVFVRTPKAKSSKVSAAKAVKTQDTGVELFYILDRLHTNGVLSTAEFTEEKQLLLECVSKNSASELAKKKQEYSTLEKYAELLSKGILTKQELDSIKANGNK